MTSANRVPSKVDLDKRGANGHGPDNLISEILPPLTGHSTLTYQHRGCDFEEPYEVAGDNLLTPLAQPLATGERFCHRRCCELGNVGFLWNIPLAILLLSGEALNSTTARSSPRCQGPSR
jgi:hypothetical protein